jgi:hypothetical protein
MSALWQPLRLPESPQLGREEPDASAVPHHSAPKISGLSSGFHSAVTHTESARAATARQRLGTKLIG